MKKNLLLSVLITIFLSEPIIAQINYNISNYKLPDINWRYLETGIDLDGNSYSYQLPNGFSSSEKYKNNSYNGNISLRFKSFANSSVYQKQTIFQTHLSSNLYNNTNDNYKMKANAIIPTISYLRTNRHYYNSNRFFESDIQLNYAFQNTYEKLDDNWGSLSKQNLRTHSLLVYSPLKIGVGRIEPIEDARHALYVVNELSKANRIAGDLKNVDINEFAEFVSKLKSKRFFDSRLQRQYEIEAVDSFLTIKGYRLNPDSRYFTTLTDIWEYGRTVARNSGTRFSFTVNPGFYIYDYFQSFSDDFSTDKMHFRLTNFICNAGFEFTREKPINLYWQNTINIKGYTGIIFGNMNDKIVSDKSTVNIPNIQFGYSQKIGFYPNTRTDLSLSYSLSYAQTFDKTDYQADILSIKAKGCMASLNFTANYYISPKLRFRISSSLYQLWQDSEDEASINFNDQLGSNFLIKELASGADLNNITYLEKEFHNSFLISLIYSIF